jgi:Zn-dependent M16 (insulinase) family peptidase
MAAYEARPFTEGERFAGFVVDAARPSKELSGVLYTMTHEASGAKLAWLANGEDNKLFSISFRTVPEDSTGVFHILEHTVLCGSDKFPVKEPFVDLLKGSMNTFLNAMTYPDKTVYPVSSRNPRDLLNLAEVYLDAVFAPRLRTDRNIFRQEGWHIEQEPAEGSAKPRLSFKGVVFNEMKGSMSDKEEILRQDLYTAMFPDSPYRFNSGGDPARISELSYEQYLETYGRFYHPSNALIYLDGSVPIEELLKLLDGYLAERAGGDFAPVPGIPMQEPKGSFGEDFYELAPGEDPKDKSLLSMGKPLCRYDDRLKGYAADIISTAIASFNEAPLTAAVLGSGLAQDLELFVDSGVLQPSVQLTARNVADGREEELLELISGTVRRLCDEGLDRGLLEAYINRYEFTVREGSQPAGLRRAIRALGYWLYGGDPLDALEYRDVFARLRELLSTDYYEKLLAEMLLDREHSSVLITRPSATYGAGLRAAEEAKLAEMTAGWTDADYADNLRMNEALALWQSTPDSPEASASIPQLPLSEVSEQQYIPPTEEKDLGGDRLLYHSIPTNGIVYVSMYFSLAELGLADLTRFAPDMLLADLPTAEHSVAELEKEIKTRTGELRFRLNAFRDKDYLSLCTPYLVVSCSMLEENVDRAAALVREILLESDFTALAAARDLVMQDYIRVKDAWVDSGHMLAQVTALSGYSSDNAVANAITGYGHTRWLDSFGENIDEELGPWMDWLAGTLKKVICREKLTLSVTATELPDVSAFADIPQGEPAMQATSYEAALPARSAVVIPAQIGFSSQALNLRAIGSEYSGSLAVAANIVTLSYLWNEVRVQGGAYGTGVRLGTLGNLSTYSYRDPSPAASIETNRGIAAFLRAFGDSGEDLDKYIISTVAGLEPVVSAKTYGALADNRWFSGVSEKLALKWRRQMLETDIDDIIEAAEVFERLAEEGAVCVVAHEAAADALEGAERLPL